RAGPSASRPPAGPRRSAGGPWSRCAARRGSTRSRRAGPARPRRATRHPPWAHHLHPGFRRATMRTMRTTARTSDLEATVHARSRRAAQSAFFTQGFVFITLTTRLPAVQDHWGYSDTTLSLLLLMMVLLAGLGSVLAETACRRVDSAA